MLLNVASATAAAAATTAAGCTAAAIGVAAGGMDRPHLTKLKAMVKRQAAASRAVAVKRPLRAKRARKLNLPASNNLLLTAPATMKQWVCSANPKIPRCPSCCQILAAPGATESPVCMTDTCRASQPPWRFNIDSLMRHLRIHLCHIWVPGTSNSASRSIEQWISVLSRIRPAVELSGI